MRMFAVVGMVAASLASAALTYEALAEGDLSTRCQKLPELVLGTDDAGYAVSQSEYAIETGQCYKLEIKSTGRKEFVLRGAEFFRNMWLRKIEVGGVEIKATHIYEIEFEDEGEAELFFTFIKPGSYTLGAVGLEAKGTVVTFKVK